MFLTISESDAFRCTVNTALDLQKAGREPSYRSPRCCVLCSSPRSNTWSYAQARGMMSRSRLLRLNSGCRAADQAGLVVRPVSARQPSMRWLRYWMCRRPRRMRWARCSGVLKATLESQPRRRRDQIPSTGLRSGA